MLYCQDRVKSCCIHCTKKLKMLCLYWLYYAIMILFFAVQLKMAEQKEPPWEIRVSSSKIKGKKGKKGKKGGLFPAGTFVVYLQIVLSNHQNGDNVRKRSKILVKKGIANPPHAKFKPHITLMELHFPMGIKNKDQICNELLKKAKQLIGQLKGPLFLDPRQHGGAENSDNYALLGKGKEWLVKKFSLSLSFDITQHFRKPIHKLLQKMLRVNGGKNAFCKTPCGEYFTCGEYGVPSYAFGNGVFVGHLSICKLTAYGVTLGLDTILSYTSGIGVWIDVL